MMETLFENKHLLSILTIFTVLCGVLVIPYTLTRYNARWIPRWIRPRDNYLNRAFRYYYPATESRVFFAISLFFIVFIYAIPIYVKEWTVSTESILLYYAAVMPAYLLHRIICFHKLNEFTPVSVDEGTNWLNVYRIWKAALLWISVLVILIASLFGWVSPYWLRMFTLVGAIVAIFAHFIDIKRYIESNRDVLNSKKCSRIFLESMPFSYYLVFAVTSVTLTQAALWWSMPVLLIAWLVLVMVFTLVEYHFRFVSIYQVDEVEQWGEESYNLLYTPKEELWLLRRRENAALRKKNSSCWIVITVTAAMPWHHKIQLTANLEYKQREIALRNEKLLYIRRFDTVNEAKSYAKSIDSRELADRKIRELNPMYDDLNRESTRMLSFFNTMI